MIMLFYRKNRKIDDEVDQDGACLKLILTFELFLVL